MDTSSKTVLRKLAEAGWQVIRQKGSHVQLRHPTSPWLVTVPHPERDLPIGTARSIEKRSGVKLR